MPLTEEYALGIAGLIARRRKALASISVSEFEAFLTFAFAHKGLEVKPWDYFSSAHGRSLVNVIPGFYPNGRSFVGIIGFRHYAPTRRLFTVAELEEFTSIAVIEGADSAGLITSYQFATDVEQYTSHPHYPYRWRLRLDDEKFVVEFAREVAGKQKKHAQQIVSRARQLRLHEKGRIIDPKPDVLLTDRTFSQLHANAEEKKRIIKAEVLPFRVLHDVLTDPRHLYGLTPRQFEKFTAELLDGLGFKNVILTPFKADGGIDVVASRIVYDIPITFLFQCKKYARENKVQLDCLRSLLGVVSHHPKEANIGVLVTTSRFTRGCKELILSEARLDGKDYDGLLGWIEKYKNIYPRKQ